MDAMEIAGLILVSTGCACIIMWAAVRLGLKPRKIKIDEFVDIRFWK